MLTTALRRLLPFRRPPLTTSSAPVTFSAIFSTSPSHHKSNPKPLPPRPEVSESEISESFLKGSGPGGQKINKTASAVQLHHLPTGLVVKSQATRSRGQNRKIARRLLAEKLEVLDKGAESRTEVKRDRKRRKEASRAKKARRKYRALDAARGEAEGGERAVGEDEADGEDEESGELDGGKKGEDGGERPQDPPRI